MQRAGHATARLAMALAPHAPLMWVLAGPGNNGGDGLVAALALHQAGQPVGVTCYGAPDTLPADAAHALALARQAGVLFAAPPAPWAPDTLVIDALLGLGAARAPAGDVATVVAALNRAQGITVLAIDLPSGLQADTGQAWGEHCVRADHTLCLLTAKPGLFTGAGRDWAGRVWLDTLDATDALTAEPPTAWLSSTQLAHSPPRPHNRNKGSHGDVLVVGGAPGMVGAAWLAGRAALAAGAGRVHLHLLDRHAPGTDAAQAELMLHDADWLAHRPHWAQATVVCGCGGGTAVGATLPTLIAHAERLVLDADALNLLARMPGATHRLTERARRGQRTVLTPHPLEAARWLGCDAQAVQADRLAAAQTLAERCAATVILKGSGSVVAAPGRTPMINHSGSAALASAGTGDVLAGWLGGLWAQAAAAVAVAVATSPAQTASADVSDDPFDTVCAAVYRHGLAADRRGCRLMRASDLVEALARQG